MQAKLTRDDASDFIKYYVPCIILAAFTLIAGKILPVVRRGEVESFGRLTSF